MNNEFKKIGSEPKFGFGQKVKTKFFEGYIIGIRFIDNKPCWAYTVQVVGANKRHIAFEKFLQLVTDDV